MNRFHLESMPDEIELLRQRIAELERINNDQQAENETLRRQVANLQQTLAEERAHQYQSTLEWRKIQRVVEQSPASIVITDTNGSISYVNPKFTEITGYTQEEAIGQNPRILKSGELSTDNYKNLWQTVLAGHEWRGEFHNRRKDGTFFWEFASISPIFDTDGNITHFLAIKEDITSRKQAEFALRESEQRYRSIFEQATIGIFQSTLSGQLLTVNPALARMLGYATPAEMIAAIHDIETQLYVEPEHRREMIQQVLETERTTWLETRFWHKDHREIVARINLWTARDEQDQVQFLEGVVEDITSRKQMEQELARSLALLQAAIESSMSGILVIGNDSEPITYNRKFVELWQLPDNWTHMPTSRERLQMLAEQTSDPALFLQRVEELYLEPEADGYDLLTLRDGRIIERYSNPYRVEGQIIGRLWLFHDVTDRQRAAEALQWSNNQLKLWVAQLEERNRDMTLLKEMGDLLQSCQHVEDAYSIIGQFASRLFEGHAGVLYIFNSSHVPVEAVTTWGNIQPHEFLQRPSHCWVMQHKQRMLASSDTNNPHTIPTRTQCEHLNTANLSSCICEPLVIQGETFGVLHVRGNADTPIRVSDRWERLATIVADHLALSLSNLQLRERLREQSMHDPLTGLFNRRYLDEFLEREIRKALRYQRTIGVIMLDIDHFKQINDTQGHEGGDAVLRAVGQFLKTQLRNEDIVCRYGGEEFTLLLPEASLEITRKRAEQIRQGISQVEVRHEGKILPPVSASLGVSCFPTHGAVSRVLLRAADNALYQAKNDGRNRVVVARLVM